MANKKKREARARNDGKAFEALVHRIESTLRPVGAQVELDVKVTDANEAERQIDVVVTLPGTPPKRAAFECRDRSRASDIIWIDQCVGKYIDLDFDRVVVISTKSLGATARKKAARHEIEVRTCSELTQAELLKWLGDIKVYLDYDHGRVTWIEVEFDLNAPERPSAPEIAPALVGEAERMQKTGRIGGLALFTDEKGEARITINEMVTLAQRQGWHPPPGSLTNVTQTTVTVTPTSVFIETTAGRRLVKLITMGFVGANMRSEIPLERFLDRGASPDRVVADGRWTDHEEEKRIDVTVVATEDGPLRMRVAQRKLLED